MEDHHVYKFSYDSEEDALKSLANYHNVSVDIIKFKFPDINHIIKQNIEIGSQTDIGILIFQIQALLKPRLHDNCDKFKVYFYHRCGSKGESWFKEGLLNSFDGLDSLITKINVLISNPLDHSTIENLKYKLRERHSYEEQRRDKSGVFGFFRLEDAIHHSNELFDLAEVFLDIKDSFDTKKDFDKFYNSIKLELDSTVVKFYVEWSVCELDYLVYWYWRLLCQKFDEVQSIGAGMDVGRGHTIPCEQIEKIIYLNRKEESKV